MAVAIYAEHDAGFSRKFGQGLELTKSERAETIQWIREAGIRSKQQLDGRLAAAERAYTDMTAVQLPLFGLRFDVNDLGIVSGLCLAILSVILYFACCRELDSLTLAARKAIDLKILEDAYALLSMSEMFHMPRIVRRPGDPQFLAQRVRLTTRIVGWMAHNVSMEFYQVLIAMPFLAEFFMFLFDLSTANSGNVLSSLGTRAALMTECVFSMVLALLAYRTAAVAAHTRFVWIQFCEIAEAVVGQDHSFDMSIE